MTLVFVLALLALYAFARFRPARRGKIHFTPDTHQLGWRDRSDGRIEVRVAGHFTYYGPMLHIRDIRLQDTEPVDLFTEITPLDAAATFNLKELFLDRSPRHVAASLLLTSHAVNPGEVLTRKLILRDRNNREFSVGPLEFPYNPALRTVNTDGKIRAITPAA